MKLNRRDFLKIGGGGLLGVVLGQGVQCATRKIVGDRETTAEDVPEQDHAPKLPAHPDLEMGNDDLAALRNRIAEVSEAIRKSDPRIGNIQVAMHEHFNYSSTDWLIRVYSERRQCDAIVQMCISDEFLLCDGIDAAQWISGQVITEFEWLDGQGQIDAGGKT